MKRVYGYHLARRSMLFSLLTIVVGTAIEAFWISNFNSAFVIVFSPVLVLMGIQICFAVANIYRLSASTFRYAIESTLTVNDGRILEEVPFECSGNLNVFNFFGSNRVLLEGVVTVRTFSLQSTVDREIRLTRSRARSTRGFKSDPLLYRDSRPYQGSGVLSFDLKVRKVGHLFAGPATSEDVLILFSEAKSERSL